MANNKINFKKMSTEAKVYVKTFNESVVALAEEDLRFKEITRKLKNKLNAIYDQRSDAMDAGMSLEEAMQKYPSLETEKQLAAEKILHDCICEPLRDKVEASYKFIPEGMFEAYSSMITTLSRGAFVTKIRLFLENLGLDCSKSQTEKFANNMVMFFGAKTATAKDIVNNGKLTSAMKNKQFNKLFMSVFCDMFMNDDILNSRPEQETKQAEQETKQAEQETKQAEQETKQAEQDELISLWKKCTAKEKEKISKLRNITVERGASEQEEESVKKAIMKILNKHR